MWNACMQLRSLVKVFERLFLRQSAAGFPLSCWGFFIHLNPSWILVVITGVFFSIQDSRSPPLFQSWTFISQLGGVASQDVWWYLLIMNQHVKDIISQFPSGSNEGVLNLGKKTKNLHLGRNTLHNKKHPSLYGHVSNTVFFLTPKIDRQKSPKGEANKAMEGYTCTTVQAWSGSLITSFHLENEGGFSWGKLWGKLLPFFWLV